MIYAGFWRRLATFAVDIAFLSSVVGVLNLFVTDNPYNVEGSGLFGTVTAWLYFALLQSSRLEASLGKLLLGIRVVDLNGRRLSFGRATVRFFSMFLSAFLFYAGFLMAAFTSHKQALHDFIAGTLVIRKPE